MEEGTNRNPDQLLEDLRREERRRERGRLKVFLGMCPGVGKTYAMLEAARRELRSGKDVVVGFVETHGRAETAALIRGLPTIPRRRTEYRGVDLFDFDLDATLARGPRLVLVDELAHTNAPGSRHPKRWQDVQELREAGIDVYTTLNVQHVESRADTVRQIGGAEVRETVPDSVLDSAVLELVDLPPAELLQRLHEGKVYVPERAAAAARNFFRESNLTALRELALRLVADHVGEDTREFRKARSESAAWKTGHRLLVAVGPSPSSESLIRWTRRTADSLHASWLAVHVEGPEPLAEDAEGRLAANLSCARELGAEVITTTDTDLVAGLLRVARDHNASQIVVGKPAGVGWRERRRGARLLRRLVRESGDIDLQVVRPEKARVGTPSRPEGLRVPQVRRSHHRQYLTAVGIVAAIGVINLGLNEWVGPRVPGLVFLLGVVLLALVVGRGPVLAAGALSALAWNFFFLPPRFTLTFARLEDAVLFGTYFVVAVVLGQLVARIREQAEAERRREVRATALYELSRDLAGAASRDEVVWELVSQVSRVFGATVAVALKDGDRLMPHPDGTLTLTEKDLGVAEWAVRHRQAAGRFTDNLPAAPTLHLPLMTERRTFGVLAVGLPGRSLPLAQRELLETFARQAALVLDRVDLLVAAERARWVAESERLGRTLLNSISHELRTPLAASDGAVSALVECDNLTSDASRSLLDEIRQANRRLNRIVGNLLDMSRLESGQVRPRLDWHDVGDLIRTTLRELPREAEQHPIRVELPEEPLIACLDFQLVLQVLANLLFNAMVHTPAGTSVILRAEREGANLVLTVADDGPGLPAGMTDRVFEKFVRGERAPAGGSGLGLAIVKGFVEAHGGNVTATRPTSGGASFVVRIPQPPRPSGDATS